MCSHIFVAMGMWDDVVAANEAAVRVVDKARAARSQAPSACGHYNFWLEYGYLQQARFADAKKLVANCYAAAQKAQPSSHDAGHAMDYADPSLDSFVDMRSRYLIDTEDWSSDAASWRVARTAGQADVTATFVDGFAAARQGKVDAAQKALDRLKAGAAEVAAKLDRDHTTNPSERGRLTILEQQLAATVQAARGQARQAADALRSAAATEDKLPFDFGPPYIEKPTYELLGEILLDANEPKEARAAFEKALARTPDRTAALTGLMRAAEKMGDRRKADEIRARLQTIWRRADHPTSTISAGAR